MTRKIYVRDAETIHEALRRFRGRVDKATWIPVHKRLIRQKIKRGERRGQKELSALLTQMLAQRVQDPNYRQPRSP